MIKEKNKNERGFTLIEQIIYISLIVVMITIFTGFITDVIRGATKVVDAKEVMQNNQLAIARITQEIKTAKQIVSVEPQKLTIVDRNDNTSFFYLDTTEKSIRYDNSIEDLRITNDEVLVTVLNFSSVGNIIDIDLSMKKNKKHSNTGDPYELNSSSTAVPRPGLY